MQVDARSDGYEYATGRVVVSGPDRVEGRLAQPRWFGEPPEGHGCRPGRSLGKCAARLCVGRAEAAASFRPREYWRGPQWPVVAWLLGWAFGRRGWAERAELLRQEGMRLVGHGHFAEYYEPFTGEPLGSMRQSWTAAAVLDWLC